MNFIQQYSRIEGLTGIKQWVRFVVSNTYEELFLTSGIPVDIFTLESLKEDLNIDEGAFAIDEMTFSIPEGACVEENHKNALAFTLEAKDSKLNRYCAIFFPESETANSTINNLRYIGKIKDKVDWEDKVWRSSVLFTDTPNAIRNYKFSALTFDMSVLEKCTFKTAIYKTDPSTGSQIKIPNIYDMIAEGGAYKAGRLVRVTEWNSSTTYKSGEECKIGTKYYKFVPVIPDPSNAPTSTNQHPLSNTNIWVDCGEVAIVDLFEIKKAVAYNHSPTDIACLRPIGNLYSAINELYLKKASIILKQLLNSEITFTLKTGSLGVNATQAYLEHDQALQITEATSSMFELKFDTNITNSIYIHRRMIKSNLGGFDNELQTYYGYYATDYTRNNVCKRPEYPTPDSEKNHSFESLNEVSNLLFELARAFGSYVFARNTSSNNIEIEFRPRQTMLESGLTYVVGINSATGNTAVATSNDTQAFYSESSPFSTDGIDTVWVSDYMNSDGSIRPSNSSREDTSKHFTEVKEARKIEGDRTGIKYKKLILSSGITIFATTPSNDKYVTYRQFMNTIFDIALAQQASLYAADPLILEHISTAIYASVNGTQYAPIYKLYAKLNGETIKDSNGIDGCILSEYVNTIMGHDKTYYETEYEWTIPSWNGFSKSSSGTSLSWKNIKRGSKILIKDRARIYNQITGQWTEITDPNGIEFVVVGIETSLDKPQTKIKLHYTSRFAYSLYYSGKPGEVPLSSNKTIVFTTPVAVSPDVNSKNMTCGGVIKKGSAVRLAANGQIYQAENNATYYGNTIGIATKDGAIGELIPVQVTGEIVLDVYNFASDKIGKFVNARTNANMNLTTNIITAKTGNETTRLIVGKVTGTKSMLINIDELELKY